MFRLLADHLILAPSRAAVESDGKQRRELELDGGAASVELYCESTAGDRPPDLLILKFPGAGGRAERATPHPADAWPQTPAEVWTVNPPGYGGARGRAGLRWLGPVAEAATGAAVAAAEGRPVILVGNSLGCVSALYAAARRPVSGLLLRNPPDLRRVVWRRFGWPTLGLAQLVAQQVPRALCSFTNAAHCTAPALFVSSQRDRIVPPPIQNEIIASYGGPHRILRLPLAGHATPIGDEDAERYLGDLAWLCQASLPPGTGEAPR